MEESIFLIKSFLKDKKVCTIAPSSKFLVRKICKNIDFRRKKVIVEYGPGTGPITRHILSKMSKNSKLILIETNKYLADRLRKLNDPRVYIFNDSAENIKEILKKCNEKKIDYIISGIPFSRIRERDKKRILKKSHEVLKDNGMFLVYQVSYHIVKYLKSLKFKSIKKGFELLNVPPLCVVEAVK